MAKKPRLLVDQQDSAIREAVLRVPDAKPLRKRLDADDDLRRRARQRIFRRYVREGGDPTSLQAFLDWLLKNLPAIIAIIASLFA